MCKNQLWLKISKHYILNLLNLRNTQITRRLWKDGLVNECLLKVRVQLSLNYGKSESLFELKTQNGNKHFQEIKFICLKLLVQGHFHESSRIRAASLMRNISWLMSFCGILVFSVWGSSMTNLIDAFYHSPAKFDFNPKITYTGVSVWF